MSEQTEMQPEMLQVTPSELVPLLNHLISRRKPNGELKPIKAPFVWGAPGIGKTDIIRSIAKMHGSRIVALHLPQYDPTDLKGIPVRMDDGQVRWVPWSYLPQQETIYGIAAKSVSFIFTYATDLAIYLFDEDGNEVAGWNDPTTDDYNNAFEGSFSTSNIGPMWTVNLDAIPDFPCTMIVVDKAIIFLDELSAADPSTQNAALQLVLDRRVGEYDVPYGVPVVAAGNREEDGAFVQPMSHPLCNRFAHLILVPSVEDFIDWSMMNDVRPEIIGVIKWNPDLLFDYNPDTLVNGHYGFSTPRSWVTLSDVYLEIEDFKNMCAGGTPTQVLAQAERLRRCLFSGIVGSGQALTFIGYLQVMHDLPSTDDIAAGGAPPIEGVERSQTFGLLYALIFKLNHFYKTCYDTSLRANEQEDAWTIPRDNIIAYITDNFQEEAGAWAFCMINQKTDIELPALRGDSFLRFSKTFLGAMTRMARPKKKN